MAFTEENIKTFMAAIVIIAGANIGSVLNATNPDIRADSSTGSDAAALESHILREAERERVILKREIMAEINATNLVEERECNKYRRAVADRLSVIEQNQKHCMQMIRQHGIKP